MVQEDGRTGRLGNWVSVIVMVMLISRRDCGGTDRCLAQKGNSQVMGCNGPVEMGWAGL